MRAPLPRLLSALAVPAAVTALALARSPAETPPVEPERLLFLLEYIAADYEAAVQQGAVIDAFEYREMQDLTQLLFDQTDHLQKRGASEEIREGLADLREHVRVHDPFLEVRSLARSLAERLAGELKLVRLPARPPDLEHGRQLYALDCAACHGPAGGGDGPSAPGMSPPATSFRDARMNLISPRHVYSAITFGIDGTAMPTYYGALAEDDAWDLAFFVMTLREGFDPRPPERKLHLSLADLVNRSNDELLAQVSAGEIDYYRQHSGLLQAGESSNGMATSNPLPSTPELQLALGLQQAFSRVAETAAPSLVGVTSFMRSAADPQGGAAPQPAGNGSWIEPTLDEQLYPGFRRHRSGSGFLVDGEGYLLTSRHLLAGPDDKAVDVVDIELHGGRHVLGRVVGTEPTLDLGVVQLELFEAARPPELRPARIGDSDTMRVGHWAIALGNPWGPGTIFAVGPLSSQPGRTCYQSDLTATLMQSALRIPPGGYGGPLLNISGEVVGLTMPAPGAKPDEPEPGRAAEFALPINTAMGIYQALRVKETRESPWLGISVLELPAARRNREASGGEPLKLPRTGVYIDDVYRPSPAEAAGIRVGDSLVSIDGNRLLSVLDFQKWLYLSGIGRTVTLEIYRDGKLREQKVTIEERPASATAR